MESVENQTNQKSIVNTAKKAEQEVVVAVEKVAQDLKIDLDHNVSIPFGIRLVTLLTLMGGVAIVGNVFADSFSFVKVNIFLYLFRLIMGLMLVLIAYLLHKRMLASVWLMGLAIVFGIFSNPFLAVVPLIAFVYLYKHHSFFVHKTQFNLGKLEIKF